MNYSKLLFLLLLLLTTPTSVLSEALPEKIKVGVLASLSGEWTVYGNPLVSGVELANNGEFELIVEDIGTMSGRDNISAAQRLIDIEKIDLAIVFAIDDAEVLFPIFNRKKIPMLVAWDSNHRIEEMGDYAFSAGYDTYQGGRTLADHFTKNLKVKRVGIIGEDCAYNRINRSGFVDRAKELNLEIVLNEFIQIGEKDLKTSLLKLNKTKAEALLFLPVLPETLFLGIKQKQQLNIKLPYATNEILVNEPAVLRANGIISGCAIWIPDENSESILKAYHEKTGRQVWNHGPLVVGYQTMEHLKAAVNANKASSIHKKLLEYFGSTRRLKKRHTLWCLENGELIEQTYLQ
ncbi:MAG: ABC transporter substrate-binding protein [Bdellovibrionota bacterium]